jgi:hypothetical protein
MRIWDFSDMKLAVESDVIIYRTQEHHSGFLVKSIDVSSQDVDLSSCLDMYLDNIIANVPELALALHSKGYLRGIHFVDTNQIPHLRASELPPPESGLPVFGHAGALATSLMSSLVVASRESANRKDYHGSRDRLPPRVFDPKVIEMDATAIMNFLKLHCVHQNGTYILKRQAGHQHFMLYEVSEAGKKVENVGEGFEVAKRRQFLWMLAMLSYRFALRMGSQLQYVHPLSRLMLRNRQKALFGNCIELLESIKSLGGEDHAVIKASVYEHLADIHLDRVDANSDSNGHDGSKQKTPSTQTSSPSAKASSGGARSSSSRVFDDVDDYDELVELQEASELLCKAVTALEAMADREMAKTNSDDAEAETEDAESSLEDSDENENENDTDDNAFVIESLTLQTANVLHKLIKSSLQIIPILLKSAKILLSIRTFRNLVTPINFWVKMRCYVRREIPSHEANSSGNDSSASRLWAADITIIDNLAILWNLLGEGCREILKQTGGVSMHSEELLDSIDQIAVSFNELGMSVLPFSASDNSGLPFSAGSEPSAKEPQQSAKKLSERAKKQQKQQQRQGQQRFNKELDHHWEVMVGTLSNAFGSSEKYKQRIELITYLDDELKHRSTANNASKCASVFQSLYLLHDVVFRTLTKRRLQLPHWLKSSATTSSSRITAFSDGVFDVSYDFADDYDLRVLLLLLCCFSSSTMLSFRSICNEHSGHCKAEQAKLKLAQQRAGGQFISEEANFMMQISSNIRIRDCIRRVADTCNVIASRYVGHVQAHCTEAIARFTSHQHFNLALAEVFFTCGVVLFHSVNDDVNSCKLVCNMSSVLRSSCVSRIMGKYFDATSFSFISLMEFIDTAFVNNSGLYSEPLYMFTVSTLEWALGSCERSRSLLQMRQQQQQQVQHISNVLDSIVLEEGMTLLTLGKLNCAVMTYDSI